MSLIINVGIIGFGFSGRVFQSPIIAALKEYNISKIYTTNNQYRDMAIRLYPNTKVVSSTNDILLDKEIDLVIICTPNTTHYTLAKEALLNGKHVVVEKPFTVTSKEADDLIRLSKECDKVLSVYHNRRFDSDYKTVRKIINEGILGDFVEYESHYDRFRNYFKEGAWREKNLPGSGILYDLGSHLIDQAISLFGMPKKIFADVRVQRYGGQTDDYFEIILYYSRLKVTLKSGMLVRQSLPRFILHGHNGTFVKYGLDIQENALKSGLTPNTTEDWGKEPEALWGTINTSINDIHIHGKVESEIGDYRDYYRNIYNSIKNEEVLSVSPEDARDVIYLIEKAIESNKKGKVINLEEESE